MSECSRSALVVKRHTSQIASIFSSNRARIASFSVAASIPSVSTTSVANEPPPVHAVSASCSAAHAPTCGRRFTAPEAQYTPANTAGPMGAWLAAGMGGEAWAADTHSRERRLRRWIAAGSVWGKARQRQKWGAEVLCKPPAWPMC
jgi:hypothetical protein